MSVKRTESRISPGLITLVLGVLAWQGLSLFFLPIVFPGPVTLLKRMFVIYSDPASYWVVGETLLRIFEGFVISMVAGTAFGLADGLEAQLRDFLR